MCETTSWRHGNLTPSNWIARDTDLELITRAGYNSLPRPEPDPCFIRPVAKNIILP